MTLFTREGMLVLLAFMGITVCVTLFVQNSINKAIERRAISLSNNDSSMINALGKMAGKNVQKNKKNVKENLPNKPPEGSGKRYTPL